MPPKAPERPRPRVVERDVEPGVRAEVDAQRARVAAQRRPPASTPSAGGSARATGDERGAHEALRVGGERDHRPGARGVAADAAEHDHDAARRGVGEAPVVALEAHPVRAARIAERRVRSGAAVGLEKGHGAPGYSLWRSGPTTDPRCRPWRQRRPRPRTMVGGRRPSSSERRPTSASASAAIAPARASDVGPSSTAMDATPQLERATSVAGPADGAALAAKPAATMTRPRPIFQRRRSRMLLDEGIVTATSMSRA